MAFEITSFVVSETLSHGSEEDEVAITGAVPRISQSFPESFLLTAGSSGVDGVTTVAYLQGSATTTPTAHAIGSGGGGVPTGGGPSGIGAAGVETFTKLRFWKVYNLDQTNDLIVWGGTDAPTKLATKITIPPCTAANMSSVQGRNPSLAGWAIASSSKFNMESSAGTVAYLAILAGE